jgi:hypothetical protein
MIDVHLGCRVEDSTVVKTGRILLELLEEDHFESFHLGFCDRHSEATFGGSYMRVTSIRTTRELFYYLGYTTADREIFYSGMVQKNLPLLGDFKSNICNYLNRFDIIGFYERNNLATQQMLP